MIYWYNVGGDRARLLYEADMSKVYAVIAPNMGKQIVAFQVREGHLCHSCHKAFVSKGLLSNQVVSALIFCIF
jgi:hypothetical protein